MRRPPKVTTTTTTTTRRAVLIITVTKEEEKEETEGRKSPGRSNNNNNNNNKGLRNKEEGKAIKAVKEDPIRVRITTKRIYTKTSEGYTTTWKFGEDSCKS